MIIKIVQLTGRGESKFKTILLMESKEVMVTLMDGDHGDIKLKNTFKIYFRRFVEGDIINFK